MDTAWNKAARAYPFQCNGCEDSCCKSLFFHYTHIEKDYLLYGFSQLSLMKQQAVKKLAKTYCDTTFIRTGEIKSKNIMCPANEDGLCLLYKFRPMICRLHGIPHELNRPGSESICAPGCDAGNFSNKPYIPFDRTPFYQQMAQIEAEYKFRINSQNKIKQTIAQMITAQDIPEPST